MTLCHVHVHARSITIRFNPAEDYLAPQNKIEQQKIVSGHERFIIKKLLLQPLQMHAQMERFN